MNLQQLLSVSGKPGLYRMITNKKSGLIIESLVDGKREFASSRQHQFTPLESIAIFTDDGDSVPVREVLEKMMEQIEDNPLPDAKAESGAFREYLLDVLPNHDQERVYVSDIKKLTKWYAILDASGALTAEEPAAEDADETAVDNEESEELDGATKSPAPAPKPKKAQAIKPPAKPGMTGNTKPGKQANVSVAKGGGQRKMGG